MVLGVKAGEGYYPSVLPSENTHSVHSKLVEVHKILRRVVPHIDKIFPSTPLPASDERKAMRRRFGIGNTGAMGNEGMAEP
jgi:hypothetical protein